MLLRKLEGFRAILDAESWQDGQGLRTSLIVIGDPVVFGHNHKGPVQRLSLAKEVHTLEGTVGCRSNRMWGRIGRTGPTKQSRVELGSPRDVLDRDLEPADCAGVVP